MVLILEKLKCGPKPKKCCNCTTFSTLKIFILPHMEIYYYINSYLYMQIRAQISSAGGGGNRVGHAPLTYQVGPVLKNLLGSKEPLIVACHTPLNWQYLQFTNKYHYVQCCFLIQDLSDHVTQRAHWGSKIFWLSIYGNTWIEGETNFKQWG